MDFVHNPYMCGPPRVGMYGSEAAGIPVAALNIKLLEPLAQGASRFEK